MLRYASYYLTYSNCAYLSSMNTACWSYVLWLIQSLCSWTANKSNIIILVGLKQPLSSWTPSWLHSHTNNYSSPKNFWNVVAKFKKKFNNGIQERSCQDKEIMRSEKQRNNLFEGSLVTRILMRSAPFYILSILSTHYSSSVYQKSVSCWNEK